MFKRIEASFQSFFTDFGGIVLTFVQGLSEFRLSRNERNRLLYQMMRVGWETVPLAILIGLFTGMTLALGTGIVLSQFGQERWIARVVSASMIQEMGPVFTAFIVAARVGASITAELGTMAVNDEVNVLRVLGIRVHRYLVMPRVIAALTMLPALTAYSTVVGLLGGAAVSLNYFDVSWVTYRSESFIFVEVSDVMKGLFKGLVFGCIYSSVCCYYGLMTTGGADGVGKSTTKAVVVSLGGILVANYLLTRFLYG